MIIKCFRCEREIDTPNASNADYVIASDTIVREPVEVFIALKHNQTTLDKAAKMKETETYLGKDGVTEHTRLKYPDIAILEDEYDTVEVPDVRSAQKSFGEDLVKCSAEIREKDIQKTGVICPECYKPTDTVIWGIHKGK